MEVDIEITDLLNRIHVLEKMLLELLYDYYKLKTN